MKTKIVLWASNEKDEKMLLAIELLEKENQVAIHHFSENVATEVFYNQMMNIWRDGGKVPFPEVHETIIRDLKMAEGLLPDNIKTERTDIINRAKTEWHFVVLSNKLSDSLKDEINEIKERIENLTEFDNGVWEEMKGFWSKVQGQVREKNLFREHGNELRKTTNELFEKMKGLKKVMDGEFQKVSEGHLKTFFEKLDDIEERITKGLGLQPIFNELKSLQNQFRDTDFSRKDRNKVWKKLDNAFKKVKEKRYGDKKDGGGSSALSRLQRRLDGLLSAIGKMEASINWDQKEIDFQNKRINNPGGQLEAQLRQAKLAMIEERINSKKEKLKDMHATKAEIETKIIAETKREEKRKEKQEVKKEKEEVKAQIAAKIEENKTELEAKSEKLEKAAKDIKSTKKKPAKKKAVDKKVETPPPAPETAATPIVAAAVISESEIVSEITPEAVKSDAGKSEEE